MNTKYVGAPNDVDFEQFKDNCVSILGLRESINVEPVRINFVNGISVDFVFHFNVINV